MSKQKKAAFHNLGCKVNSYETEGMLEAMRNAGYEIVDFEEKADVYIVNTCSVTNIADRKSRQMLHRAKHLNPDACIVAVGCYVQAKGEDILKDESVDIAIGNDKKADLPAILDEYFRGQGESFFCKDIGRSCDYENIPIHSSGEHTRAYVKVQDGCNQFCSYCIIPYTRGRIRSRRLEDTLTEIHELSEKGVSEVVLTGIHLSSYGLENKGKNIDYAVQGLDNSPLLELIKAVAAVPGIARVRLGSLEPRIITENFVSALAQIPELCPHFHLSLQSGCDVTLKRMNRHYTSAQYREKCDLLRTHFDNPAITTDVIVGFPGETEEEFETTYTYLQDLGLYEMHIFKFSERQGTVAAKLPDKLTERVKSERSAKLLALTADLSAKYRREFIGKDVEVLWEDEEAIDGQTYLTGYTKEYIRVAAPTSDNFTSGTVLKGKLTAPLTDEIMLFSAEDYKKPLENPTEMY